jgi:outer membrane protein assembly factor BamB
MKLKHFLFLNSVALLLLVAVATLTADDKDWPTFRGADRTNVAPDTGLLEQWPEDGPELAWEAAGAGRGYASVAISGGRLYTLGDGVSTAEDEDEYLTCFDRATGKQLWKSKTGAAYKLRQASWESSRSTPTVDGDRVYVLSPQGKLVCVNTDGVEQWQVDLTTTFNGKKAEMWGYSESVLIDGDNVICTPGGSENTMVALNKKTGKQVWSTSRPNDRGAGHASIVISEIGPTRVYVQTTGSGAMGVRATDGKLLWTYDIDKTTAVIPTPIVRDDLVFFSAGYGRGGALLRQSADGDGVKVEEIYPLNPKLGNKHGGIVLVGDYLYGDSDDRGTPFCAELMTGEVKWKSRGSGKNSASVVAADEHVYIRYADGTMTLVKADPESFQEVSHFKVPGSGDRPSWAHPVICEGRLYLREGDKILCYKISGSESAASTARANTKGFKKK